MIFRPAIYALTYVLTALGAVLLVVLMIYLTGINISSAAMQFLPVVVAAMVEGHHLGKSGAPQPSNGAMWRAAVAMTGMAAGLLLMWTWGQLMTAGQVVSSQMLFIIGLMVFAYLIANRWFFQLGFRSGAADRAG